MLLSCLETKIGHIPKEIFRAVSFFINQGGKVTGSIYSLSVVYCNKRFRSINRLQVKKASKLKLLERLKNINERNYDKPIKASVEPIEYLDYLASNQKVEEKPNDYELNVLFIDDKEDQRGLKKHAMT